MTAKQLLVTSLFLIVLVIASTIAKSIILGGLPELSLQSAPPLAGTISQSIATPQSKGSLPVLGKDFTIRSSHYFDNQQWVVATVMQTSDMNSAVLVLEKLNGNYQVVLGPGTSFATSDVQLMPADVVAYLTSQGMVSNATYSQ